MKQTEAYGQINEANRSYGQINGENKEELCW